MQLSRLTSVSCSACRSSVVRSFLSVSTASEPGAAAASRIAVATRRKEFSTSVRRRNNGEKTLTPPEVLTEVRDTAIPSKKDGVDSVPWYMQNQTTRPVPSEIAKRQQIPELPLSSPAILADLLHYVSVDLGIDDLTILDLRELDPPAALGANLIMVLGTARSERHLHVSADRCCRWLRATHKLRPVADGLLGRNELKLKLRRQAKKVKLLRSVGAPTAENIPEELRPGWVCVNVGRVEGGALEAKQKDIIGFDESKKGASLVVQMMTEERREALDLEGLWTKALKRQKREREETNEDSDAVAPLNFKATPSLQIALGQRFEYQNPFIPLDKSLQEEIVTNASAQTGRLNEHEAMEKWQAIQVLPDHNLAFGVENPVASRLLDELRLMPLDMAKKSLGRDSKDYWSTPFLTEFYQAQSPYPTTAADWACRIALVSYGAELGHKGYTAHDVYSLYREAVDSGLLIHNDIYVVTLRGLFSSATKPEPWQFFAVLDVLQSMSYSGMYIYSNELFLSLFMLIERLPSLRSRRSPHTSTLKLHDLMRKAVTFPPSNAIVEYLLQYFADNRLFNRFWLTWSDCALQHKRRDSQLYQLMFEAVAADGSISHISRALSVCFEEMQSESPPVEWTPGLVNSIRACVLALVPDVRDLARLNQVELEERTFDDPKTAYWVLIWKICSHAESENWHSGVPSQQQAPAQIGSVSSSSPSRQADQRFSEGTMDEILIQG